MIKNQLYFFLCLFLIGSLSISAQIGNEFQGSGTGLNITSGDYISSFGDSAGFSVTSGSRSTYLGYKAGYSHTSQTDNTFIGTYAGEFAVTGTDNVFIGTYAGRFCDGTDNTVIGVEAGMAMISGASDNVIIGEEAGQALLDGDDNVFIGEDAGYNTTTASDNTFVGNTAGRSNTTGFANAFFGDEAGYDNTTGYKNTAVGDSAGIDNGVGRLNTFVGNGSGCATEHADYNTFVGAYAGGDNNRNNYTDDANRNTYMGVFTGFTNRRGEDNVGMGAFANYSQNFDVLNITGQWGGPTSSTTRSRTTFIGAQSYPNNNDVIAIGYKARVDGQYGTAIGNYSRAQKNYAVAIGYNVTVNQINTMALGGDQESNRLSVGIGTVAANQNASLELADTDKGFLINRLTTAERNSLSFDDGITPPILGITEEGLMVYDTDLNSLSIWDGTVWNAMEANTDAQELSVATDILSITGSAATVDLTPYLDNTDAQELSVATDVLSITGSAATVDLTPYLDNTDAQELSLSGAVLGITGNATTVDLSVLQDGTGTDAQELSLSGTTLGITGNATTVDLSVLQDGTGTDAQNLTSATILGNDLTVAIEGGTSVTVDLSPILASLEAENTTQQTQIDDLLNRIGVLEGCACGGTLASTDRMSTPKNGVILYQNIPNPFNGTTTIKYYVPLSYKKAAIVFSNTSGQIIDNISLKQLGDQELFFNSDSLASGTYFYTLYVDDRKIDTKKMIIE